MNANYSLLISRLDNVRVAKPRADHASAHLANCPICAGKQKLSVTETELGVILIHCHKCHAGADVAAAVGLDAADLFPPRQHHGARLYKSVSEWASLSATSSQLSENMFLLSAMIRYRYPKSDDLAALADDIEAQASGVMRQAKAAMREHAGSKS